MGDFGLNQTFEYLELALDSSDAQVAGGNLNPSTASDRLSWPLFYFNSKQLNVAAIKVISAEIPHTWLNVTTANNNFVYTAAGVPNNLTIPAGNYTGAQLAAALQTAIAAVSAGFTVTFNAITSRFTFTQALAIAWSLNFTSRSSLYSLLGFLVNTPVSATGIGSTITSTNYAFLAVGRYLYINSRRFGTLVNFNLPDSATNVGPQIARVPITAAFGQTIFYTDPDPNKYFDFFVGGEITNIGIYLTLGSDQSQIPLDLQGAPFSLKLGILTYRSATVELYEKSEKGLKIIKS